MQLLVVIAKASLNIAGGFDSVFKEFEVLMIYTYTPFLYGEHVDTAYWDRQVHNVHVRVWFCGVSFVCLVTCQITHFVVPIKILITFLYVLLFIIYYFFCGLVKFCLLLVVWIVQES